MLSVVEELRALFEAYSKKGYPPIGDFSLGDLEEDVLARVQNLSDDYDACFAEFYKMENDYIEECLKTKELEGRFAEIRKHIPNIIQCRMDVMEQDKEFAIYRELAYIKREIERELGLVGET